MVRKTRYHIEYSTCTQDIIENSQNIEKSTGMLRKNDPKGLMVMGSDLPWDLIRELPVPETESIQ